LLKRFGQIGRPPAQFIEQPRVLDGDNGLGGEVCKQLDLLVGEWADFPAIDRDRTDEFVILEHGDEDQRTATTQFDGSYDIGIAIDVVLLGHGIDNVNRATSANDAAKTTYWSWTDWAALLKFRKRRGRAAERDCSEGVVLKSVQDAEMGLTEPRRVFQHRIEHWSKFAR